MIDFLIVGQGIAGSILAWHLTKAGKKVLILDDSPPAFFSKTTNKIVNSPKSGKLLKYADMIYPFVKSVLGNNYHLKVIGGLITPVTGKRFVKTWLADELLPYAATFYTFVERELSSSFYKPSPIVRLFADAYQANNMSVRRLETNYKNYFIDYNFSNNQVNANYGYAVLNHGAVVDGIEMISAFHRYFYERQLIKNRTFNTADLIFKQQSVEWENIRAKSVIFCEGWKAINNPFFKDLPFIPAKGELLIFKSEKLKLRELINRGIFIRPMNNDLYLAGSTYTWNDLSLETTLEAKEELETKLKSTINCEYSIIDQLAGIRPTVKGRRPIMGKHYQHDNMFIFNGLGTKGLLLAPYFSNHFCAFLLKKQALLPEVDVSRFY